jgi:YHS domain-containing protein
VPGIIELPGQPDSKPKTDRGGLEPPSPSKKESVLPDMTIPPNFSPPPITPLVSPPGNPPANPPVTPPVTPAAELPKTPAKDGSAPPPSFSIPDLAPSPPAKPQALSPDLPSKGNSAPTPDLPSKGSLLARPAKDAVAASPTAIQNDLPIRANWNASLGPDAAADNQLRRTNYEERTEEAGNPLRRGLEGYCPVQLKEHDRWVAGNSDFELAYQGQVFHFSSEAARKQFEAAPEKYAPVHSGNDIVLAVEENRSVPGSVTHSAVWHGRLYLFSSSASLAVFQHDPARYANEPRQTPLQVPADSL